MPSPSVNVKQPHDDLENDDLEMESQRQGEDPMPAPEHQKLGHQKVVAFEDLAGGQRVVVIELNGQRYRLRLTKAGRLILTK